MPIEQIPFNKYTEDRIDVGKNKAKTMFDRVLLRLKMKERLTNIFVRMICTQMLNPELRKISWAKKENTRNFNRNFEFQARNIGR